MKRFVSLVLTFVIAFNLMIVNTSNIQVDAKMDWKKLYKKYLKNEDNVFSSDDRDGAYYLIYLDNNNIPEILYLSPMARVMKLYYIHNNKVKTYDPYGYEFAYIKKGGIFYTAYSHMGGTVCSLDKLSGGKVKNVHKCSFYTEYETGEISDCKFDDNDVSYAELKNKYNTVLCKKLKKAKYLEINNDEEYIGRAVLISQFLNK